MTPGKAADEQVGELPLHDLEPALATMRADVLEGLRSSPKYLPSQYLYDERGARLFEQICEQPEYYITRTELEILSSHMASIAERIGPRALLIEPGSGEGTKSSLMLAGLSDPAGFVPLDISRAQLVELAESMAVKFPGLTVAPVCADFTTEPEIPKLPGPIGRRVVFFPGSTIGNLEPERAVDVLRHLRGLAGEEGSVLLGIDLRKSSEILEPAYDDAAGVSSDFALNYLRRLNDELGATFDVAAFGYEAPFDPEHGRIEMALVSKRSQEVEVGGARVHLAKDERIRTEYSYKYNLDEFLEVAARAGLAREALWTDPDRWFAVLLLGRL